MSPQTSSNPKKPQPHSTTPNTYPPTITRGNRESPRQAFPTSHHLYDSSSGHSHRGTECNQTCGRKNISVYSKLGQANPGSMGPDRSGTPTASHSMTRPTAIRQQVGKRSNICFAARGAEVSRKRSSTVGTVVPSAGILHARLFRPSYQHAPPILEDPHILSIQFSLKEVE